MSKVNPFLRFVNLMSALRPVGHPCEMETFLRYAKILALICTQLESGGVVTITTLVYSEGLGTRITVYNKIKELEALGYLILGPGKDKRVREIQLAAAGKDLIQIWANKIDASCSMCCPILGS